MKGAGSAGDTGSLLDHLNQRSAPSAAVLINNLGVNAGHCGIFLSSGPVCGGLLEHEAWCQEAKSASHTDLIHQGWRVEGRWKLR